MSSAMISLLGFYRYDMHLFDKLELPEGLDREQLVNTILMRGGEYEVIYSDPDLLFELIGAWSKNWKPVFTNWLRANVDLSNVAPLENYDRVENWSDSASTSENESLSSSESSAGSSSVSGSDSSSGSESMSENANISAFDSNTLVPQSSGAKTASTQTNASTLTTQENTQNSSGETNRQKGNESYSTHGGRIHGNIGVTTSAMMFREWYDVLQKYNNIYDAIATVFLQAFVIPIL